MCSQQPIIHSSLAMICEIYSVSWKQVHDDVMWNAPVIGALINAGQLWDHIVSRSVMTHDIICWNL